MMKLLLDEATFCAVDAGTLVFIDLVVRRLDGQ